MMRPVAMAAAVERGSGTLGPREKKARIEIPPDTTTTPLHPSRESCSPANTRAPNATSSGALPRAMGRSEEHTSELQSLMRISYAVFCLKKTKERQRKSHK